MNLELNIEELSLLGFSKSQSSRIVMAMQMELTRLLSRSDMPESLPQNVELAALDAGSFNMQPGMKPEHVGAEVARSIFRGMKKK